MKKKTRPILSAHVSKIAKLLYDQVSKVRPRGWFSRFVEGKLVEAYAKDFMRNALKDHLLELQDKRDRIEKEIKTVADKIKRYKR